MKISGGERIIGVLLGSVAAIVAAADTMTAAQAADAALKKAAPVKFVKVCDIYGNGFFQLPGTVFCLAYRGQLQVDTNFEAPRDAVFVSQDTKKTGAFSTTFVPAGSEDVSGYQVQIKPTFDLRTETAFGTLRTVVEPRVVFNEGIFNGGQGPGFEANKTPDCYRCYTQWAGFTVGTQASYFKYLDQEGIQTFTVGEAESSLLFAFTYNWTKMTPGTPNPKGFAPYPDGLSSSISLEDPNKHTAKGQAGGNTLAGLGNLNVPGVAAGTVDPIPGPLKAPDIVGNFRYEADEPNTLSWQVAGILHQISETTNVGTNGIIPGCIPNCSVAFGPSARTTGWAALAGARWNLPFLPGTNRGALTLGNFLWLQANYGDGSIESVGIGGITGNFSIGDNPGETTGGLTRDDHDAIAINNGVGGLILEKEKAFSANAELRVFLTDCTDPVKCWRLNLIGNYAEVRPGTITSNTDWTQGGLAKADRRGFGGNITWGASRWAGDIGLEVMYFSLHQALPCNNNGNAALAVCGTPTVIPFGLAQNPSNIAYRVTFTKNW
jgi:Porin subfamily